MIVTTGPKAMASRRRLPAASRPLETERPQRAQAALVRLGQVRLDVDGDRAEEVDVQVPPGMGHVMTSPGLPEEIADLIRP